MIKRNKAIFYFVKIMLAIINLKNSVQTMTFENSNYVYALKDPRKKPAQIFYIGKGTGSRKEDHLINTDNTLKGKYIREILNDGYNVIVTILSDSLTEIQALKLEAELISAFGTKKNGGILLNSVNPSGIVNKAYNKLNLPFGVYERAQIGIDMLKSATVEFIKANPEGIKNNELAKYLDLQSDNNGKQKDYLTYSILGILMKENIIFKTEDSKYKIK